MIIGMINLLVNFSTFQFSKPITSIIVIGRKYGTVTFLWQWPVPPPQGCVRTESIAPELNNLNKVLSEDIVTFKNKI